MHYGISEPVDAAAATRTEGRLWVFIKINTYPVGVSARRGKIAELSSLLQKKATTPL